MVWLEVSVTTDGEGAEAVSEALRPFAYQDSVAIEQSGDETSLDPDALDPAVTVKIYIPGDEDTPALRRKIEETLFYLSRLYPMPPPRFLELADEDWANAWKAHYHPFKIGGRIWIRPSWEEAGPDVVVEQDDIVLVLDPGMAFGTGLHPTTQSCLKALERLVEPGMRVLDAGTGSGILAVAAARLGATEIAAFDTDEMAVRSAVANAQENDVGQSIMIWQGDLSGVTEHTGRTEWDIVVVNILAPIIIRLLNENDLLGYVAPAGRLILSGIIDQQGPQVVEAVTSAGGQIVDTIESGDWVSYVVGRSEAGQ